MEQQDLQEIIQYFNSIRNQNRIWIEAEMPNSAKTSFDTKYQRLTNLPVPSVSDAYPYYVWPFGTNKWGVELRVYFLSDASMPISMRRLLTDNSRKGYEMYNYRINNNDVIWELFANDFHLGMN